MQAWEAAPAREPASLGDGGNESLEEMPKLLVRPDRLGRGEYAKLRFGATFIPRNEGVVNPLQTRKPRSSATGVVQRAAGSGDRKRGSP